MEEVSIRGGRDKFVFESWVNDGTTVNKAFLIELHCTILMPVDLKSSVSCADFITSEGAVLFSHGI